MGRYPMAGVGWQALQYLLGLSRLGYEVFYAEDSGAHPYNPVQMTVTDDCAYNVNFLRTGMAKIGLGDRWIYWDEPSDTYHGLGKAALHELYRSCGSIWNLCGASQIGDVHRQGAKLVTSRPIRSTSSSAPPRGTLACAPARQPRLPCSPTARTSAPPTVRCRCRATPGTRPVRRSWSTCGRRRCRRTAAPTRPSRPGRTRARTSSSAARPTAGRST